MGESSKKCPACGLINLNTTLVCDCGFDFTADAARLKFFSRWWPGVNWNEAIRIWWFMFWRFTVLGFLVGFVIGFIGGFLGLPRWVYMGTSLIAGVALVWPVVMSQALKKHFRGFRLLIVRDAG